MTRTIILAILALALPVWAAEPERPSKLYRASQLAYVAAQFADVASSRGLHEHNALLASNGALGGRGVAVKLSIGGAWLVAQELLMRRHWRVVTWTNFAVAAGTGVVAGMNWGKR